MKNKGFVVTVLLLSICSLTYADKFKAPVDYFSGFYVGIMGGVDSVSDDLRIQSEVLVLEGGENRFAYGVYGGYGKELPRNLYFGADVFYRNNSARSLMGAFVDVGDTDFVSDLVYSRTRDAYGIEFTPGYLVAPNVLVKFIVGVESGQVGFKILDSADGTTVRDTREPGWFPGAGINIALNKNFQLGASWTYHFFKTARWMVTDDGQLGSVTVRALRPIAMLNATYRFA